MNILWMILTGLTAFTLGRSVLIWGFLSYALGWPILLVTLLLGPKIKTWERRAEIAQVFADKLQNTNKSEEYKDFNTVDDLFKQLETK